ncbi:MAG TPA: hypothetical protein VJS20_01230 [Gemmatimonadales bacterium]|nr:hypothetical protein [Gemmatimonadales bacterium]
MNRSTRIASGIALALLVVTCTDKNLNGPRYRALVGLNLSAFRNPPASSGQPPIPIDSVTVDLTSLDGADDYDTTFAFGGLAYTGGALTASLKVPLKHASQIFALGVTVKGQGYTWYVASDTVTVVAGNNAGPNLLARLVGPGSNAGNLFIGPQDTTVVPGLPVTLYASVGDSFEGTLTGVPVGFRLQNPALGVITYPTYLTPILVPINPGTKVDTTWLIGETPNHILDSTQIYIVPKTGGGAPTFIYIAGGDAQVDTPKAVLPLPLQTLVTDVNGIPVALAKVAWAKTGLGSLVTPDTTVADSFGFAKATYKLGTGIGTDTITASIVGVFAGPPPSVTFTATADTGLTLSFDTAAYMLGKGQVSYYGLVSTRIPVGTDLTVKLGRSDSATSAGLQKFGLSANTVIIPAGTTQGCCIQITGNNLGSATLIAHAAGYQNATANVIVTTPMLVVDSILYTYDGTLSVPTLLETADSTGAVHFTATDLVITDSTADSTIAKADSATYTIPAGNFYALPYVGGVKPGSTSVTWRAPGYPAAVTQVQVDTAFLYVYAGAPYAVGLGQTTIDNYMYFPANVKSAVVISLSSSDPAVFTVPATVTMLPDSYFVYFPITGKGLGSANLTVRVPGGFVSDSVQAMTVNTPLIQPVVSCCVSRGVKTQVYVYAEDTLGFRYGTVNAPVNVTVSTTDPNAVWDSTHLTIPVGSYYDSVGVVFNSTGLFNVNATAAGYTSGTTSTNAAAPPVGVSAARSAITPMRIKVIPMYPDSLRRKVSPQVRRKPAPPRR